MLRKGSDLKGRLEAHMVNHSSGFTSTTDGQIVDVKELGGYMVSIASFSCADGKIPDLDKWQAKKAYIGGWFSGGKWYIDVSINIPGLQSALEIARKMRELAIFDCKNLRDISVG